MRRTLALLVVISLAVTVAPAAAAKRAKTPRLKAFTSCAGLISYARRHAPPPRLLLPPRRVPSVPIQGGGEDGGSGPVAVPAPAPESGSTAPDSSTTNVQEAGVDEPDIVKTDGTTVFALTGGRLHAVDARSPVPRKLDAVTIPGFGGELLIQGRRALTISNGGAGTVLTEIDIANPAAMRVLRTLNIDGDYVSARLHGHTARVVVSSEPRALDVPIPAPPPIPVEASTAAKKRKPLRARRAGWVPNATLRNRRSGRKRKRALVACDDVRRTPRFTGAGMLTVVTIDLAVGLQKLDTDSVMTERRHRLRVADEPLRRHQRRLAERRHLDPPLRPRRRRRHRLPRQRPGARRPAQPVRALRVQGRAARRDHRGVLGRQPEPRHRRCRRAPAGSRRSGRSAGSGAASGSTRCASSRTAATS